MDMAAMVIAAMKSDRTKRAKGTRAESIRRRVGTRYSNSLLDRHEKKRRTVTQSLDCPRPSPEKHAAQSPTVGHDRAMRLQIGKVLKTCSKFRASWFTPD
jgi:hypothetical protein